MSHLITCVLVIGNILVPNLAGSTGKPVDKSKFHGVWQIEDIQVSAGLFFRKRTLERHLGDSVIWDMNENMVIGLPLLEFVGLEFQSAAKSDNDAVVVEFRAPDSPPKATGQLGLVSASDKRLLVCYALSPGGEAPNDFDVESSSGSLISLVLRRAVNDDGIKTTKQIVDKMQGKWLVLTAIATDSDGEPIVARGGKHITVRGNVFEIEKLDDKPGLDNIYRVPFAGNGAERPARIYTGDFCGIVGFEEPDLLKIAAFRADRFEKIMVPRKLDPPDSLDEIGPRKLYLVLKRWEEKSRP